MVQEDLNDSINYYDINEEREYCLCNSILEDCEIHNSLKCAYNVENNILEFLKIHHWDSEFSYKFLKIRHNIFAESFMLDNGIDVRETDYCLRNLGIDSDLTPDIYLGNNKFIEFFVSSNTEFAIQNKISKYGKFPELELIYVYYDTRDRRIYCSNEEISCDIGVNLSRFIEFFSRNYNLMKYVRLDSSDLECNLITKGYNYPVKKRTVNYVREYDEFTYEEYSYQINRIRDRLCDLDDEDSYDLVFDCETRKFEIKRGGNKWSLIYDNMNDFFFVKRITIYKNFRIKEVDLSLRNLEMIDSGYFNLGENHKIVIPKRESYESCLEYPIPSREIYDNIKKIEFNGLYSNILSVSSIKEIGENFLREWEMKSNSVSFPKIKMMTMLPIPDPNLALKYNHSKMKFNNPLNNYLLSAADIKNYSPPKIVITEDEEKMFVENKTEIDKINAMMKSVRREWSKVVGVNKMSYDIKVINNSMRESMKGIRPSLKEKRKLIDSIQSLLKIDDTVKESYLSLMVEKELRNRINRKISKRKIYRDNMFYLDRRHYTSSQEEKKNVMNNFNNDRESDERMGMNGYFGVMTFLELESLIGNSWNYMIREGESCDWYDMEISNLSFPDNRPGKDMKSYYIRFRAIYDNLKKTNIYKIICILSNLAKTIWAISTYKTKKRAVVFDKFGTKSCYVFCNGTGTIQKFKSSKAFKVLIPYNDLLNNLCGFDRKNSWNDYCTDSEGKKFFISHWAYLKIQHLKYFMELPMRWIQICSCIITEYNLNFNESNVFQILTMNMLNARRKTENLLHDMKYLTYNMFGIRGCYSDLLIDKFDIPNDMWMRYLEEKFLRNIGRFIDSLENNNILSVEQISGYPSYRIFHPLSDDYSNLDIFNLYVYSSYVFPKGVFTHYTEQQVNMRGIMEIHHKAMTYLGDSKTYQDVALKSDVNFQDIFSNDLNYVGGVVSAVGVFAEAELMNNDSGAILRSKWNKIVNSDITEYANSHGLRGEDLSIKANWGKKGHDIMTEYISNNTTEDEIREISNIKIPEGIYDIKKIKYALMSTKKSIWKFGREHEVSEIQLNNANKVQWGGSREIYIMTFGAKNIQWSLEQMFKSISELIENELIHVPASQRLNKLYNEIKGVPNGIRYYLTLDCRKWAPLSNMNKYLIFLNSMSGLLPPEFLKDFNYFFRLYYQKKLFFKKYDVEEFLKHDRNKIFKDYFFKSGEAYYIQMPYSFMMGMFNYLSSIYHAMTQRFFIKEIIPLIENEHHCKIIMKMFAHSDDSGGFIEISGTSDYEKVMSNVVKIYESFQKCNNHMLSLKKCAISNSYFEITSYCFMKTDPMPVLPKFIYNHQINLTPSGYISDVKSLSSQVIEMVMNGASFQCSAIKYICLGQSYRIHCLGEKINDNTSRISLDLLGFPIIHPYYIIVFKGNSEKMWIQQISNKLWQNNESLMESIGTLGDWGEKRGLAVHMITFKSRNNDGRFSKFEYNSQIPDDIIPSGHYLTYMMKMSSRYYRDSMWYSLHDIDGTILQSNMFNNGLCQSYKVNGSFYGIRTLSKIIKTTMLRYEEEDDGRFYTEHTNKLDTYSQQINDYILLNQNAEYKPSQTRAKPSSINTYYSQWWKRNQGDIKSSILYIMCQWMCLLNTDPRDIPTIRGISQSLSIHELINSLLKEEPLMRIEMLTRCQTRLLDRSDTIGSWYYTNSYPYSTPIRLKRVPISIIKPDNNIHPECIASFLFEISQKNIEVNMGEIELVSESKEGLEIRVGCIDWLRKSAISDDPMVRMVISKPKYEWIDRIDFIAIKQNQYSQKGKYWIGRTTLFARISLRQYELSVNNGRIIRIKCKTEYSIKNIMDDMSVLSSYGFDYNINISKSKIRRQNRITVDLLGNWGWTTEATGTEYYDNILVDQNIEYSGKLELKRLDAPRENIEMNDIIMEYKKHIILQMNGMRLKCYLICRKPCDSCLSKIMVNKNRVSGTTIKHKCNYTKREIIENFPNTQIYNLLFKYYQEYYYMIPERSRYMCSPGSIMSCIYSKKYDSASISYMVDYRDELILNSMSETEIDDKTINRLKTEMSNYMNLKNIGGKIILQCDEEKMNEIINKEGIVNVCTALALLPLQRTKRYYSLMTDNEYWYNNTEVLPLFIKDTLSYIASTINLQEGGTTRKNEIFHKICDEILYWVTVVYSLMVKRKFFWRETIDLKLINLLGQFSDIGESSDPEISQNYFYDPCSIVGSMMGFMRYILCYSFRRLGKLEENYQRGYKNIFNSFHKRYRTFVKDKFGYSVNVKRYDEMNISICPHYDHFDFNEERFYPTRECDPDDFCDEDCFDEEMMTYSKDEALFDWDIKEGVEYDYCNHSVFMEEGDTIRCGIMDPLEIVNWKYNKGTDVLDFKLTLEWENGEVAISIKNYEFIRSNSRFIESNDKGKEIMSVVAQNFEDDMNNNLRVIDQLVSELTGEEYSFAVRNKIVKFDQKTKKYRVDNSGVLGVMAKTFILDKLGIRDNDISRIVETEKTMSRIEEDVEEMRYSNLDQNALAELEVISPNLVRMMKTNSFRITETAYREIRNSYMNSQFKNQHLRYFYNSILKSVLITKIPDMMTENTFTTLVEIREQLTTRTTKYKEEQMPFPGKVNPKEFTIHYE